MLITRTQPFMSTEHNPSYLSSKPLNGVSLSLPGGQVTVHITVIEVEVAYSVVLDLVPGLHAVPPVLPDAETEAPVPPPGGYDFIFHIGQGREGHIALETLAHQTGYEIPDVRNEQAPKMPSRKRGEKVPRGAGPAYDDFENELTTEIDVQKLVKFLRLVRMQLHCQDSVHETDIYTQTDDNIQQSFDPGRYLCDFIFYCSLAEAQRKSLRPTGVSAKVLFMHVPPAGVPHTLGEMTDTIRKVVSWVALNHIAV